MNPYQNPSIYIGSLRIDEPITALTNLFFAGCCLYAFLKTKEQQPFIGPNLYRWFFIFIGLSAIIAAITGHGFLYVFGFKAKIIGWEANVLGVAFAQVASIYRAKPFLKESVFKWVLIVNYIEIVLAFILTYTIFSFTVVEVHSAISLLLFVCVLEGMIYKKTKSPLSKYVLFGVGVVVVTVFIHLFQLAISVWFNHLDLSHIVMCFTIYFFYKGLKLNKPTLSI